MADERELGRIFEEERQLALEETRAWIEALPEAQRAAPFLNVGGRDFSPLEILREIEAETEFGRIFVRQVTAQRLEAARRSEEIDAARRDLED